MSEFREFEEQFTMQDDPTETGGPTRERISRQEIVEAVIEAIRRGELRLRVGGDGIGGDPVEVW